MTPTPHHANTGTCPRCQMILDRYPGFYKPLRDWFEAFQLKNPEGHLSCAGRGHDEQQALFYRKATLAQWGKSAHNWNAAIDMFCMIPDNGDIYDRVWFHDTLAPAIPAYFQWYGRSGSPFYELPHIEIGNWRVSSASGDIHLVETFV